MCHDHFKVLSFVSKVNHKQFFYNYMFLMLILSQVRLVKVRRAQYDQDSDRIGPCGCGLQKLLDIGNKIAPILKEWGGGFKGQKLKLVRASPLFQKKILYLKITKEKWKKNFYFQGLLPTNIKKLLYFIPKDFKWVQFLIPEILPTDFKKIIILDVDLRFR